MSRRFYVSAFVVFVILVSITALQVSQTLAAAPDVSKADDDSSKHWSFVSPRRSEPPKVKQTSWIRTPIDNFILAKLENQGIQPSPEADRNTLIRRLSFDLLGLPPTPGEWTHFCATNAPMLTSDWSIGCSPRLITVNAGAGIGLILPVMPTATVTRKDSLRALTPGFIETWVIDALNRDLPFDQFTIRTTGG
jgi:hypothetical protein